MIVIETCPKCGSDLTEMMSLSFPPVRVKLCSYCGWSWPEDKGGIVRVQFDPERAAAQSDVPPSCRLCPQHPSNGGSGICHCTLGTQTVYY